MARWNHGGTPPPPSHLLKGVQKGFGVSALCRCLRLTPRQPPRPPGVAVPTSVQGSAPSPRHLSQERRGFLGSPDSPQRWVRVWDPPIQRDKFRTPLPTSGGGGTDGNGAGPGQGEQLTQPCNTCVRRRCKIFLPLRIMAGQKKKHTTPPRGCFCLPRAPIPSVP